MEKFSEKIPFECLEEVGDMKPVVKMYLLLYDQENVVVVSPVNEAVYLSRESLDPPLSVFSKKPLHQ